MKNPIKIVRKKGFILNPNDEKISEIINKIILNQGHCPTEIKDRNGHDQCPCSDYLQNSICHCKLYIELNEDKDEKVKEIYRNYQRKFI